MAPFPVVAHPEWAEQESRWPHSDLPLMSPWLCKLGDRTVRLSGGRRDLERKGSKEQREEEEGAMHGKWLWIIYKVTAVSAFYLPLSPFLFSISSHVLPSLLVSHFSSHPLRLPSGLPCIPDEIGLGNILDAVKKTLGANDTHCICPSECVTVCVCDCVCVLWVQAS